MTQLINPHDSNWLLGGKDNMEAPCLKTATSPETSTA
jgi:hypothetical protein